MVHRGPPPFTKPMRFPLGGGAGFNLHRPTLASPDVAAVTRATTFSPAATASRPHSRARRSSATPSRTPGTKHHFAFSSTFCPFVRDETTGRYLCKTLTLS